MEGSSCHQPYRMGTNPSSLSRTFLLSALKFPHPGKPFRAKQTSTVGHPVPGLKLNFLIYKNRNNNVYVTRISMHIKLEQLLLLLLLILLLFLLLLI